MPTPSTPLSSGRGVLRMPPSRPIPALRDGRSAIETIVTEGSMINFHSRRIGEGTFAQDAGLFYTAMPPQSHSELVEEPSESRVFATHLSPLLAPSRSHSVVEIVAGPPRRAPRALLAGTTGGGWAVL